MELKLQRRNENVRNDNQRARKQNLDGVTCTRVTRSNDKRHRQSRQKKNHSQRYENKSWRLHNENRKSLAFEGKSNIK